MVSGVTVVTGWLQGGYRVVQGGNRVVTEW